LSSLSDRLTASCASRATPIIFSDSRPLSKTCLQRQMTC
jgi:hypothetical protein